MQNVIVHETLPGHHLQIAFLAERGRKGNHPIARLISFNGPSEGWATYAEAFAREIDLYDSDFDYIGMLMSSITPMMVVDLGMQVKGWTTDQAIAYLQEAMPMRPPERAARSVATISGLPGACSPTRSAASNGRRCAIARRPSSVIASMCARFTSFCWRTACCRSRR